MRHTLVFLLSLGLFLFAFLSSMAGTEAGDAKDVRAMLKTLLAAAADEDAGALVEALGPDALKAVPSERRDTCMADLRAAFMGARVGTVELARDTAVAELTRSGRIKDKSQVLLMRDGRIWRLASPYAYPVDSADLDARRGKKPAEFSLGLRTKGGAYGDTAYSFRYVTGDAKGCKNRVDIWVCHNFDIHASADGRIADVGKKKLAKVKAIPGGLSWGQAARIEVGHVYVVHCRDKRDRDFFVKLRVKSFQRDVVEMEWTLLTTGFCAPGNIHMPEPVSINAGRDGAAGLCGKNG